MLKRLREPTSAFCNGRCRVIAWSVDEREACPVHAGALRLEAHPSSCLYGIMETELQCGYAPGLCVLFFQRAMSASPAAEQSRDRTCHFRINV